LIQLLGKQAFSVENLRVEINLGVSTEKEVVDGLHLVFEFLSPAENVKLLSAEFHSLLALRLAAGKDNNVAAHGSGHLDGNVAETTDAHDGNAVSGLDSILVEDGPDSSTAAHQRGGISGVDLIGNLEDTAGIEDSSGREAANVETGIAI
jgi:hypothetical protein